MSSAQFSNQCGQPFAISCLETLGDLTPRGAATIPTLSFQQDEMRDLRLDLGKLDTLMRVEGLKVLKFLASGVTWLRWHRHGFSGCQKRSLVSFVASLGTWLASSLRFSLFSLVRRTAGVLRILSKLHLELFQTLAQLYYELMLPQYECAHTGGGLFPVRFADWKTVGNTLRRHLSMLRFRLSLISSLIFQYCIHEKGGHIPSKMRAWPKKIATP